MRIGGFAAALLLAAVLTAALAAPAQAVPLAEWEADEAKLLGEEPVTRADLPDEWQQLSDDELRQLMDEIYAEADELRDAGEDQQALPGLQRHVYLAWVLDDLKEVGTGLNAIGLVCDNLGQYERALTYYEQSLAIGREIGDRRREGVALQNIGVVFNNYYEDYEQAIEYYEQALAIYAEVGEDVNYGMTLNNIGRAHRLMGNYDEALLFYGRALDKRREIEDTRGVIQSLRDIGALYWHQLEDYEQAAPYYEQVLDLYRDLGDRQGEADTLNYIGVLRERLGSDQSAIDAYVEALAVSREAGDPSTESLVLLNIGKTYKRLEEYDEALEYLEQALDACEKADNAQRHGYVLGNMAEIARELGRTEDALAYYGLANEKFNETGDAQGQVIALHNLGSLNDDLRNNELAIEYLERSLELARETEDARGTLLALHVLGIVYGRLGKYRRAAEYLEEALSIRDLADIAPDSPPTELALLSDFGCCCTHQGLNEKALALHERVLAIYRTRGDAAGVAGAMANLGIVYSSLEQQETGLAYLRNALTAFEEQGLVHEENQALNNIGIVYDGLGQHEEALKYYEQSLGLSREVGDQDLEARTLHNMASAYHGLEMSEEALKQYEQSTAIAREIGDQFIETNGLQCMGSIYRQLEQRAKAVDCYEQCLALNQEVGNLDAELGALQGIGIVHESEDQYAEAAKYYGRAAETASSRATEFTWESGLKSGLVRDLSWTASRLTLVLFELGLLDDAFTTVQSGKGVPLLQLLMQAEVQVDDPAVQQALDSYRDAQAALQKCREDLCKLEDDDEEHRADIEARLEEYTAQANDAWDYIREHEPRLTEIIEVQGLSAEQVQAEILQPGQVVLEYMQVDGLTDDDPGSLLIFCLPWEGELTAVRTALPEPEAEAGSSWRVTPSSEQEDEDLSFDQWVTDQLVELYGKQRAASRQAGRALYELLVAPVADSIPAEAELIICPDRSLFLVPFEALVGPDDEYLLERHPLTYSTSATMLRYVKDAGGAAGALVAGVSFSGNEGGGTRSARDPLRAGLYGHRDFGPLPAVPMEARNVAALLGAEEPLLLVESQATEPALRESMPGCRVIHLATHGFLSGVPLLNGVVLYQQEEQEEEQEEEDAALDWGRDISGSDGFLRMSEVMGISLDGCELVALSCCHTAEGEANPGAGVMGMTQGFLYAGARSVLASLRGVHDDETRALMEQFYRNWQQEGLSKREALRQAKLWMLGEKGVGAAKWAPFVLYGLE